jgi:hypothetical protein
VLRYVLVMAGKRISQCEAARQYGCSDRQVRRYVAAGLISTDDDRRVLLSELQRHRGRRYLVTDLEGRTLVGEEARRLSELFRRRRVLRVLAYSLVMLRDARDLDEAVKVWFAGFSIAAPTVLNWPAAPIEKPLADALAWVPDAAMLRVLAARWLSEQSKIYPCKNIVMMTTQNMRDRGVVPVPGGFLIGTKNRSPVKVDRLGDKLLKKKVGRRALGLVARRETAGRYKFSVLLGGVSRRAACYWWQERGAVNFWPGFDEKLKAVFRADFGALSNKRCCPQCNKRIRGKPVDGTYCSVRCADDATLAEQGGDLRLEREPVNR